MDSAPGGGSGDARQESIDVHVHFIPPSAQRSPAESWLPLLHWSGDRQLVEFEGATARAVLHEFGQLDGLLSDSASMGLDRLVLSPWANLLADNFDGAQALQVADILNDGMRRATESAPARVMALGTVPMRDPVRAAHDLEELMRDARLSGVEVSTTVAGRFLGDPIFEPFWEAAEATSAPVFIHPSQKGLELPALRRHRLWNLVGNPTETAFTAADMVFSGLLERHPRLRIVLAHGGGSVLAMRGRMLHGWRVAQEARADLADSPDVSLGRFYYDTITHDPVMLRMLVALAGADHVLLGSDYPFDMAPEDPVGFVQGAGLPRAEEQMILSQNAARLLGVS